MSIIYMLCIFNTVMAVFCFLLGFQLMKNYGYLTRKGYLNRRRWKG